jgi:hypothetical protein
MDFLQSCKVAPVIAPAAIVNNASFSQLNTYLDTFGYHSVTYIVQLGALDIALTALKVTECDTSGGTYATIPLSDFSVSPLTLPAATDDNKLYAITIPVNGIRLRYQKLTVTMGNGSTGGFCSAVAILGQPDQSPYDATTRGFAQQAIVAG